MDLSAQKRLAAEVLKVSKNRVWFDPDRLKEIKKAITKFDIRKLIKMYAIQAKPKTGISRARARKLKVQKSKGRRSGPGSRKGKKNARLSKKDAWMAKVRAQRNFLKMVKDKGLVNSADYRNVYLKIKGGFFRNVRHVKLYMNEHNMFKKKS